MPKFKSPLWAAIAPGLLALGIYLWQLSVPEQISLYDTGVYMAATVHFVSGIFPYRDFTFVQPPGLLYLLSPLGLLSRLIGTHDGETVGRVLTSIVAAANCTLTAWLVRHRGRAAMLATGTLLAVTPSVFYDSSGVKLEPYCLLFILIAAIVVLARDRVSLITPRVATVAGVLIGVAALVKLWAFFPFLALAFIIALRARRQLWRFVAGAGLTVLAGLIPFLIIAPRRFVSMVFVEQLGRQVTASDRATFIGRLRAMTGFVPGWINPGQVATIAAFAVLIVLVVLALRQHVTTDADYVIGALAAFSTAMLFLGPEFYSYYAYFDQPFLIALAVVSVAVASRPLVARTRALSVSVRAKSFLRGGVLAGSLVFAAGMVLNVTTFYTNYAWFYGYYGPWLGAISRVVPANSRVVYNQVSYGIYANRFFTTDPNCPNVVDVYGQWMAHGYQLSAPSASFTSEWQSYFSRAQYVVLSSPRPGDIPWTSGLSTWFSNHFHMVYERYPVVIYQADHPKAVRV